METVPATELRHSPLEPQVRRAGGRMVARDGWLVAAHYGSPGGELALADSAVGLADRSDLGKFTLRGDADAVEQLVGQVTGGQVGAGEALLSGRAWWCAVSDEHVVVLCGAGTAAGLGGELEQAARWARGATVADATERFAALGLLGPRTQALLDDLCRSEPPLGEVEAPAFDVTVLAAVPVLLLRSSASGAIALADASRGGELWGDAERAGREFDLGHVGADAVAHISPLYG
jgi:glycine cleavage system aminomethyltransferase T